MFLALFVSQYGYTETTWPDFMKSSQGKGRNRYACNHLLYCNLELQYGALALVEDWTLIVFCYILWHLIWFCVLGSLLFLIDPESVITTSCSFVLTSLLTVLSNTCKIRCRPVWENHNGPYQSESYEEPVVTKGVFLYVINVCGEQWSWIVCSGS